MNINRNLSMKRRLITVYIVSHNYGKYLENAIESVLRQTTDSWELLVINDNSTDNTLEVMNLYKGDERVRLISTTGVGLPSVCNLAIKEAKGDYLIRLDGDDFLDENALLVLSNYLGKNQDVAMVFPDCYMIDEFDEIYAEERREKVFENNHVLDAPANGACIMIRKDVLKEIGGYREDLGAQDGFDLWAKIMSNYKCANINLPLYYYRRHGQNMTNNTQHILSARRAIKRDSIAKELDENKPVIAVIPCRRNYDFCIDFWKEKVNGITLLQRSIENCLNSSLLDYIVIVSDNHEVKDVMGLFEDKRLQFFERSREETIRSVKLVPILERIAKKYDPDMRGITTVLYLQTTFVGTATIDEAITTLVMNRADCAFAVEEINKPLYKRTHYGLQRINVAKNLTSDFDKIYQETYTALATRNRNFNTGSLTGPKIVNYIIPHEECFFISSPLMLEVARKIVEFKSS